MQYLPSDQCYILLLLLFFLGNNETARQAVRQADRRVNVVVVTGHKPLPPIMTTSNGRSPEQRQQQQHKQQLHMNAKKKRTKRKTTKRKTKNIIKIIKTNKQHLQFTTAITRYSCIQQAHVGTTATSNCSGRWLLCSSSRCCLLSLLLQQDNAKKMKSEQQTRYNFQVDNLLTTGYRLKANNKTTSFKITYNNNFCSSFAGIHKWCRTSIHKWQQKACGCGSKACRGCS